MELNEGNFSLQWNDFEANTSSSFKEMRNDKDFTDITLVSDDHQHFEAHKIILGASSWFFSKVLKQNKHRHPLIYLRSVKGSDLVSILDFIYHGEVNIQQENLEEFMKVGGELQIKGLEADGTGQMPDVGHKIADSDHEIVYRGSKTAKDGHKIADGKDGIYKNETSSQGKSFSDSTVYKRRNTTGGRMNTMAIDIHTKSEPSEGANIPDLDEGETKVLINITENPAKYLETLDLEIDSMINDAEIKGNPFTCKVCGKESNTKQHMRVPVEGAHITGPSFPCDKCNTGKFYKTRNSLDGHMSKKHRNYRDL